MIFYSALSSRKWFYNTIILGFLLSFFLCSKATAQVRGKVLSIADNKPIAGASVYVNNTSIGTTTSETGDFYLQTSGTEFNELIVSYVGYEPVLYKLSGADDAGKRLIFKLSEKQQELEAVLIIGDAERRRLLQIFKENFLGVTKEADRATIENIKDIYFLPGKTGPKSVLAKSDAPIRIKNNLLGYNISFDLVEFTYDPVGRSTSFFGYTRYESYPQKKKYVRNREKAYEGSTQHFFRSLIADKLEEEKFSMMTIQQIPGQKMDLGAPVKRSQILFKNSADTSLYVLKVEDRLQVKYLKSPPGTVYIKGKFPFAKGIFKDMVQSTFYLSAPILLTTGAVIINPLDMQVSEYWSFEKAANLLPQDYKLGD